MSELVLIEHMQHIRLILLRVESAAQPALAGNRMVIYAHIMACCQIVRVQRQCSIEQQGEANVAITRQAWVRSAPSDVFRVEVVYHVVFELLLDVHEVKGYIELACNTPRVIYRFKRAAFILYHALNPVIFE